jgi:ribose 5-phosphate isomerase
VRRPRCNAAALGIPLATLDTVPELDVAIDGSDEARGRTAVWSADVT